jgi:aspartyl-tRNA(Asn)/glutamyl-tRNA(Gln) amidotransferase subunit C
MLRFPVPERFTAQDVERLARLARVALTPDETSLFSRQLADFLAYAEQVQQLDTSGIAPMSHAIRAPTDLPSPSEPGHAPTELRHDSTELRNDEVAPSLAREIAVAEAPEAAPEVGLFKVPRVIG